MILSLLLTALAPVSLPASSSATNDIPTMLDRVSQTALPDENKGFYTDRPSYAPEDVIRIHANWQPASARYHLFRITGSATAAYPFAAGHWEWVAESGLVNYGAQAPTDYGSYVEFPTFSLEGRNQLSLCGWILPSNNVVSVGSGGEDVAVAGHLAHADMPDGSVGIGIDATGHLYGWVNTARATMADPLPCVGGPNQFEQEDWLFVALTYRKASGQISLWTFEPFGSPKWKSATAATNGRVLSEGLPFRIGSKSDAAPGSHQQHRFSGRVDNWTAWPYELSFNQLKQVKNGKKPKFEEIDPMIVLGPIDPLLDVRFEDGYGVSVADSSGNGHTGTIHNHGTPGVQGHDDGQALRLNHDQVVDMDWDAPVEAEIEVPAGARSGLYVVAGLGPAAIGPQSPFPGGFLSTVPWRTQCVVVRPEPGAEESIAVIVPTSTWTAYAGYPGKAFSPVTATGIEPRIACTTTVSGQGNNSAYGTHGDGVSRKYFVGWRRPKLTASPFGGTPNRNFYSVLAPGAIRFIEWIDREFGGTTPDYDVYSDADLGVTSRLDLADYDSVVLMCHTEYVTEEALQALDAHLANGGNILNIGANMFLFRIQLDRSNGVFEIRRWPTESGVLGPRDSYSIVAGNGAVDTGVRRFLYQAVDAGGDPERDYLLGTIADTAPRTNALPDQFGCWRVRCPTHWLFSGVSVAPGDEIGRTDIGQGQTAYDIYALGHEADTFFSDRCPPGAVEIEILADGFFAGQQTGVGTESMIDYSATLMSGATAIYTASSAQLDAVPYDFWRPLGSAVGTTWRPDIDDFVAASAPFEPRGQILTYEHMAGGRVVSVPSTAATWTLGVLNGPQEDPVNAVVRNALECFLDPLECGVSTGCEETCTTR